MLSAAQYSAIETMLLKQLLQKCQPKCKSCGWKGKGSSPSAAKQNVSEGLTLSCSLSSHLKQQKSAFLFGQAQSLVANLFSTRTGQQGVSFCTHALVVSSSERCPFFTYSVLKL